MRVMSWLDWQEAHLSTDLFAQGFQPCSISGLAWIKDLLGTTGLLLASDSTSHCGHISLGLHHHGWEPVSYLNSQHSNSWGGRRCFQGEQSLLPPTQMAEKCQEQQA